MRLALGVLVGAAGLWAMGRRSPSDRHPPQPRYDAHQRGRAAAYGDQEAHRHQPDRAEEVERQTQDRAAQQKRDESEERHKQRECRYWWVTGTAAVLATIGTLAAAGFAAGAYKASLRAVDEAQQQVRAAREANRINSDVLAASVSASVYFGPTIVNAIMVPGEPYRLAIQVTIANGGNSPTHGLRFRMTCIDSEILLKNPFDQNRLMTDRLYRLRLGPKDSRDPVACSYSPADVLRIVSQSRSIYAFGEASYSDTVNATKIHRVRFCTRVHSLDAGPPVQATYEACERNNCADDECDAEDVPPPPRPDPAAL